jgi:hypothetical protein
VSASDKKGADIMSETAARRADNVLPAAHRTARPEQIDLGNDTGIRNDLVAKEYGVTERALNGDDADGAPFIIYKKVKYRPIRAYRAYLAGKIQVRNQKRHRKGAAA